MKGIQLTGRVVVVTGGARGIGRATAQALRDAGATVVIGDIDKDELAATADEFGILSGYLDVTDPHRVDAFAADVHAHCGSLDIWINNAGIMPVGPLLDQTDSVIRRAVEINVLGVINGSRAAARHMTAHGGGRIVNIASVAGRVPAPGMAVYAGTKFAVVGFGEALDAELEPTGVRVSTIFPSFTDTGLIQGITPGPMMAPVPPERIAAAVLTVLRRGRRDIVIPGRLTAGTALWMLFPRSLAARLRRAVRLHEVFLRPDATRRTYDNRIDETSPR
jgi:NAD(P)-dependent dehydrogenase (short-subunit alcohol dehydrogenase family)